MIMADAGCELQCSVSFTCDLLEISTGWAKLNGASLHFCLQQLNTCIKLNDAKWSAAERAEGRLLRCHKVTC